MRRIWAEQAQLRRFDVRTEIQSLPLLHHDVPVVLDVVRQMVCCD
jgi:hypothetical protein